MTREEIIAQLHDIHAPPVSDAPAGFDLAIWPFGVFVAVFALTFGVRAWRRNAWRRATRRALRRVENMPDRGERWAALLDLAVRIARLRDRTTPLPAIAYRAPDRIGDEDARVLSMHIRAEIVR